MIEPVCVMATSTLLIGMRHLARIVPVRTVKVFRQLPHNQVFPLAGRVTSLDSQ